METIRENPWHVRDMRDPEDQRSFRREVHHRPALTSFLIVSILGAYAILDVVVDDEIEFFFGETVVSG